MTSTTWRQRVEQYVDDLDQIASEINGLLEATRVETPRAEAKLVEQSMQQLIVQLTRLEEKVAQRDELLRDGDAPREGATLTSKLRATRQIEDARLAKRCVALAEQLTDANQRAIALFVCQYHLADLSGEIIRLIAGSQAPATYQANHGESKIEGGGLFNEAA